MSGEIDITPGKLLAPDEGLNNDKLHQILMGLQARLGSNSIGERELALGNKAAPNDLLASLLPMVEGGELKAMRGREMPFRPGISVLKFGAKGDGTTDDSAAISDAQEFCGENGQELYFPKGTYLASGLQTGARIRWRGEPGAVIKRPDGEAMTFLTATADVDVEVTGLAFEGYYRGFALAAVNSGTKDVIFRECAARNFTGETEGATTGNGALIFVGQGGSEQKGCNRLIVEGCSFTSMNRAVQWQAQAKNAVFAYNYAKDLTGTVFQAGGQANPVGSFAGIGNRIFDVYPRDGRVESFIKALLAFGKQVAMVGNHVENLYENDYDGEKLDSEPLYTKAGQVVITGNTLLNAGLGEAAIVCKASETSSKEYIVIANNTIHFEKEWYEARQAEFGDTPLRLGGIRPTRRNALVIGNEITGYLHEGIRMRSGGLAANNIVRMEHYDIDGGHMGIYVEGDEGEGIEVTGNVVTGFSLPVYIEVLGVHVPLTRVGGNRLQAAASVTNPLSGIYHISLATRAGDVDGTFGGIIIENNQIESIDGDNPVPGVRLHNRSTSVFAADYVIVQGNVMVKVSQGVVVFPADLDYLLIRNHLQYASSGSVISAASQANVSGTLRMDAVDVPGSGARMVQNRGVATIGSLDTSATVTHLLDGAIDRANARVMLTPLGSLTAATKLWAELSDSTTFTIKVDAAPTVDLPVAWEIKSKYHL